MLGWWFPNPDSVTMPSRGSVTLSGDKQLPSGPILDRLVQSLFVEAEPEFTLDGFIPKHYKSI